MYIIMFTLIANRNDFSPVPDVSDLFSEMITPSPHGVIERLRQASSANIV